MLYEADRHEPLTSTPWDEPAVRNCVEEIALDAAARYSTRELWPPHPLEFSPDVRWNLYVGAAGVIWTLNHLASSGVSIDLPDISTTVRGLLEPNRSWIRGGNNSALGTEGLLMGDTGILLLAARLSQLASVENQIALAVDANQDNAAREFMWGSPGTALASLWLYEWTGKEIWADRFRRDVGILWERLELVEAAGCHLWSQNLYGHEAFHVGAVHGFAGNAFPVIRGWRLLTPGEQARWAERLAQSLRRTAIREDDCANWPQSVVKHRPGRTALLVQHCHGAPGIVNCFAHFPDPVIDDLLHDAGEMTWVQVHFERAPASATARPAMATPSSNYSNAAAIRVGWTARGTSRCTRSSSTRAM